ESLVYVRDTCPNAIKLSENKVSITPMNKVKKVRFSKPLTSSSNIKQVDSSKTSDSNTPVLSSTGLKCSTSTCRSQPTGCPDCSLVFGLRMFKIYDREPLSAHELRNVIFSREYYVEGLGQNLFSVGQFCDADIEVAFWINTCYIQNLEGVDLVLGSRDTNFYTISLNDMLKTSPICLLSKESKTKSWLWHCRLSHLNFGTVNKLAKDGLARGIPKLKFQKDHLCSACALEKSKKSSHQPKAEDTNQEKLYLLHMDFCGPMQVESLNGKNTAGTKVNAAGLQLNRSRIRINKWYQSFALREFDLKAMDLKWQLSLLSMRVKKYYQRTGKKIFINANYTAGYDKSKVECFNCHKMGHFARECRAPKSKEGQIKNQDNTRKQGNNEDTSSKAMLAIDGVGFD
ncbi:retrovirus-related pol polyprotein from transposon TNT 1-94, partial [Tanacetum coccineum]